MEIEQSSTEKNRAEHGWVLPEYISMYDISGLPSQGGITRHSFDRYLKDKKQDREIIDQIEYSATFYRRKIKDAPLNARAELREEVLKLIRVGLAKEDITVQKACVEMIGYAPEDARAELIRIGLTKEDITVQKACVEMIGYAPENAQAELREEVLKLIRVGLAKEDITVQKACVEMIRYASQDVKKNLFKLAKEKLGNILVEPPLYRNSGISKDKFRRATFPKTGSETTLIGGDLKDKTILRRLEPEAFLAWQRLYEDYAMWQKEGFDYVPIEPIQSYRLNKKGLVDVYSGVLDLSLDAWGQMTDDFIGELRADGEKIKAILAKLDVEHGHTHGNNFCLRFFRDKDGNVDFSRKPRIYLIDFDQAASA